MRLFCWARYSPNVRAQYRALLGSGRSSAHRARSARSRSIRRAVLSINCPRKVLFRAAGSSGSVAKPRRDLAVGTIGRASHGGMEGRHRHLIGLRSCCRPQRTDGERRPAGLDMIGVVGVAIAAWIELLTSSSPRSFSGWFYGRPLHEYGINPIPYRGYRQSSSRYPVTSVKLNTHGSYQVEIDIDKVGPVSLTKSKVQFCSDTHKRAAKIGTAQAARIQVE